VCCRPINHRGANTRDAKVGLLLLDKLPRSLLSERFGGAVRGPAVGFRLRRHLVGDGVPVFLGVGVLWTETLGRIDDGGEGGCYYDTLHVRIEFLDGF